MTEKNTTPSEVKEQLRFTYPSYELSDIIAFVTQIHLELGYTNYHDKESIAKVFGVTYSAIKNKLSTAQEYGLKHGTGYKITPLFLKIYRPENDEEKREAILESLRFSSLYRRLIEEYNGHNVPSLIGLATTLFRRYGLLEKPAEKAASIFYNNLKEFHLIGDDNILAFNSFTMLEDNNTHNNDSSAIEFKMLPPPPKTINAEVVPEDYIEIPIPVSCGKAYLRIPEKATPEDYVKIAKVVDAYK